MTKTPALGLSGFPKTAHGWWWGGIQTKAKAEPGLDRTYGAKPQKEEIIFKEFLWRTRTSFPWQIRRTDSQADQRKHPFAQNGAAVLRTEILRTGTQISTDQPSEICAPALWIAVFIYWIISFKSACYFFWVWFLKNFFKGKITTD